MSRHNVSKQIAPWVVLALVGCFFIWINNAHSVSAQGNNVGLPALAARVGVLEEALSGIEADYGDALDRIAALEEELSDLQADYGVALGQIAALEEKLQYVHVETESLNQLAGPHLIIEGCNVHVRSGLGSSKVGGYPAFNGLGNLIVGYNEEPHPDDDQPLFTAADRVGSNNLVVGDGHRYRSISGFVAGAANTLTWSYASVSGGMQNEAGLLSSVSGGWNNRASGPGASVSGGTHNTAEAYASVSGGLYNAASASWASVSGGMHNQASFIGASVTGGAENSATGPFASVSGGLQNIAIGEGSSVSGGHHNEAQGLASSVSGGFWNEAQGLASSVSGGFRNVAAEGGSHPNTHPQP